MEEEDTIIIQVIFKFEDGRMYNFDVDRTTTLYETKKILSNAAHIMKNSFTLYHEGQEYPNECEEQSLQKLFPNLKKIEFYLKLLKSKEEVDENEHEQISVKYNIKEPCKEHIGKFLVLYCISCKKSICNECFSISHNNHEVEEKADYLMPAKILMERIFSNSFMFKSDQKLSNYMTCVSFRSIIKTEIFDRLRQLITELENKCINCLEYFSFNEDSTGKNNDLNLELLKKYCTSSFIKLKNNIDTKDILINDEVFLSLYNKLKSIKEYEISLFSENCNKYKTLNTFFLPFTQEIKNMSMELMNILSMYNNKDIFAKFKEDISRNIVDVIQKEDVTRFMFENVNIPKVGTSLNKPEENCKNSLTPNVTQRLLPSILYFNDNKNNGFLQKNNVNMTVNNNSNMISGINGVIGKNSNINFQKVQEKFTISSPIQISTTKNNNNNLAISNNLINTTSISNSTAVEIPPIKIPSVQIPKVTTPPVQIPPSQIPPLQASQSQINTSQINNVNNVSTSLFSKSIFDVYHDSKILKEVKEKEKNDKMEVEELGEKTKNVNTLDMNFSKPKIEEMKVNDKINICSPINKRSLLNIHLSPTRKDINLDNRNSALSNSFIQQNCLMQSVSKEKGGVEVSSMVTSKIESHSTTTTKNSINNVSIFSGKLIDVLNKEKINNVNNVNVDSSTMEKKEEHSSSKKCQNCQAELISNNLTSIENVVTNNNENIQNNIEKMNNKSETTETNTISSQICPPKTNYLNFKFPVFKSSLIKGARDKNTVEEIKVDFSEFSTGDPLIDEFPSCGAYCNYDNVLYFTGGQEYIKESSKLFLSVSKYGQNTKATKLPPMKYSHWNHSMIGDRGKIYVVGGYNTNKCEMYDIVFKTWTEMPELTVKERQRPMLYVDNNYLYCFMGLSQDGVLDSVERISLDNIEKGWEKICVVNERNNNLKFYGAGIIRKPNSNVIAFIGGKKENKKKETLFRRSIFEFCFDNFKINVSDFKIENDLIFIESKLYEMDSSDCGNFINIGNGYLISMPILMN